MKYIKSYKIFESDDNLVYDLVTYFSTQDFNIDIKLSSHPQMKTYYNIEYKNEYYVLRELNDKKLLNVCNISTQTVKYSDKSITPKLHLIEEFDKVIKSIMHRNSALISTIGHKLFGPDFYLDMNETLVAEVLERIREFSIIKNHKLDEVSLNTLFDFYEIEYDYELFNSQYKYRLTFKNG